jgi:tubulin polyglutamylase TTLL5
MNKKLNSNELIKDINDIRNRQLTEKNENEKEEIIKEDENEEYEEEEEEEIEENNDTKNLGNNYNMFNRLINKNNSYSGSNKNRSERRKYTLNPIKSKKDLSNFNMGHNSNLYKKQKNNSNDIQNIFNIYETKNHPLNEVQTKKYVLSSVKPKMTSYYSFNKNFNKFLNQRPKSTLSKNILPENHNLNTDDIVDYSEFYQNFAELFSGYFLANNYSQQNAFSLQNTIGELYDSFNKLYYYELNQELITQKDEMYNDIVKAEAGVIINRIKHAQEKLLKEDDINTNIEKYCILRKCLELEKKNYARESQDISNYNYNNSNNCKYKKFFRVVLSRPEIYDIVCYTLYKDNTWTELPHGLSLGQCWNLYWSYGPPNIDFSKLFSFQKVNHLINNRVIHRKDMLHKHIMRVRKLNKKCNEIFNVMPLTYLLSKEYVNFVEEFHRIKDTDDYNIWIVKPVGKSRGKGIFLIDNISDVPLNDTFLVQKYLSSPLLLDEGYKFDMRIYCLVTSVNPLEMFLYKDGFARVSNELYSLDISNIKVHLTNAAIQNKKAKKSNNYEKIYGGSKISLDMLRSKLRRQYGIDFDTLIWPQVKDIIVKVFICCQNDIPYCPSTFEMFGFDVIIDSNFKCWLLEINSSPSLERSNVLDDEVKLPLVKDIIKIVEPPEIDKTALINVLERVMKIRNTPKNKNVYLYSPKIQLNIDLTNIFQGKMPRRYGEEPKDMGRFEMICPNKETDKLIKIAGGQKYYNNKREKK